MTTRREQFHDLRIGERVTAYDLAVQGRLASTQAQFQAKGFGENVALSQAYGALKRVVRHEANIMAFNDAFLIVGSVSWSGRCWCGAASARKQARARRRIKH